LKRCLGTYEPLFACSRLVGDVSTALHDLQRASEFGVNTLIIEHDGEGGWYSIPDGLAMYDFSHGHRRESADQRIRIRKVPRLMARDADELESSFGSDVFPHSRQRAWESIRHICEELCS
jgi:hypothetical protein